MFESKKVIITLVCAVLFVGVVAGFSIARNLSPMAQADNKNRQSNYGQVDKATLEQLYLAAFGRPIDTDGLKFHLGKDLKQVLRDITNSNERKYYGALVMSVKSYEDAIRAPGTLSADDTAKYKAFINSALSTLIAWVETLPDQDICKSTAGITEARAAIQAAYDSMSPAAKAAAEKGIFNALEKIGGPKNFDLPLKRCSVTPTPSLTPTP